MSLAAGKFNCRVTILKNTPTNDELNQQIDNWAEFVTVWGDVKFLSGLETVKAGAELSITRASIKIRFRRDITSAMRATFDDLVFNIRSVLPDTAGREHCYLIVESGVDNG